VQTTFFQIPKNKKSKKLKIEKLKKDLKNILEILRNAHMGNGAEKMKKKSRNLEWTHLNREEWKC
jgi:hypothetical protein